MTDYQALSGPGLGVFLRKKRNDIRHTLVLGACVCVCVEWVGLARWRGRNHLIGLNHQPSGGHAANSTFTHTFTHTDSTMFEVRLRPLHRVEPACPAAMFGVVVDKHVVRDCEDMSLDAHRSRYHHLKENNSRSCWSLFCHIFHFNLHKWQSVTFKDRIKYWTNALL